VAARPSDPIIIACGADARYACPLAVLLRSVTARLPPDCGVEFHVIDGGLGTELRGKVAAGVDPTRATIHWVLPHRAEFVGLPLWGRITIAVYDKLQVPTLLPATVSKVLWLDADILALASITELWDRELGDHLAWAAPDALVPRVSSPFGVGAHRELGLDPAVPYFNSGVMLINLDRWRREGVFRRALDYLQHHPGQVYFWDQEALNAVLAGHWGCLDPRWNWSPSLSGPEPAPALVHFTGNLKPWRCAGRSPWHARYYELLDQTAWRGWRPAGWQGSLAARYEGSSLRRVLRRLEPWGMRLWRRVTLRRATTMDVQLNPASLTLSTVTGKAPPPVP
jgi:lipopolysaccharide biosynthesis glycosyltransferase